MTAPSGVGRPDPSLLYANLPIDGETNVDGVDSSTLADGAVATDKANASRTVGDVDDFLMGSDLDSRIVLGSSPELPTVSESYDTTALRDAVNFLSNCGDLFSSSSMLSELMVLLEATQNDEKAYSELRNAGLELKLAGKDAEIFNKNVKMNAEKEASQNAMDAAGWNLAFAGIGAGLSIAGGLWDTTAPDVDQWKKITDEVVTSLGPLMGQAGQFISTLSANDDMQNGAKAAAMEADIAITASQKFQEIAENIVADAESGKQANKELKDAALQAIKNFEQNKAQAAEVIFRG